MPYRPKISDIVHRSNYKYICNQKRGGKTHRIYQITGNLFGSTMDYLMNQGFDVRVIKGAVIVARPSQMRSYKTE